MMRNHFHRQIISCAYQNDILIRKVYLSVPHKTFSLKYITYVLYRHEMYLHHNQKRTLVAIRIDTAHQTMS